MSSHGITSLLQFWPECSDSAQLIQHGTDWSATMVQAKRGTQEPWHPTGVAVGLGTRLLTWPLWQNMQDYKLILSNHLWLWLPVEVWLLISAVRPHKSELIPTSFILGCVTKRAWPHPGPVGTLLVTFFHWNRFKAFLLSNPSVCVWMTAERNFGKLYLKQERIDSEP